MLAGIICFVAGTFVGVGLTSCLVAGKRADINLEKQWRKKE